jgi:hypothetical protein
MSVSASPMSENESDFAVIEAEAAAAAALQRYQDHKMQQEEATEAAERRLDILRRWEVTGNGHLPLPASADEYEQLPLTVRMQVAGRDPELARMLQPAVPLPVSTEIRLSQGLDALLPEDAEHLLRGGYHEILAQIRERYQQQVWSSFEEAQTAAAEAAQVQQEQWEQQRREGEQRANAAARQHYISRIHAGLPPAPVRG